ncbi:polysaccharide deacetylase [Rhizobium subbaraonis]|uniref:Chitooligosaccharide deacetylase n=1 Tax=Rhizobium subbaraonis TaxID=908946 RepID=A0A285U210_9HYPH|nr:polysaccharide deacetylase family protein [Rhizobium subbaraonis]SOC35743.1 polysaccharide deacetylase [Rhizobium subbaraonis]
MKEKLIKALDLAIAKFLAVRRNEEDTLVVLAFHSVIDSMEDLQTGLLDPFQPMTVQDVEFVATLLRRRGFRLVTGNDLDAGNVRGPAAWLTFDDGYANNLKLLPLARRNDMPLTVFISSGNVASGEAFWWDVLFREESKRGTPAAAIAARRERLKACPPDEIRAAIVTSYGEGAMRPVADIDRPMTPAEVAALSREPLVEIGNHTHSHTILTVVDSGTQLSDIRRCQEELHRLTGRLPISIAFPNGAFDRGTLAAAAELGLRFGVTCLPRQTHPASFQTVNDRLTIGRFASIRHGRIEREVALATARTGFGQLRAERDRRLNAERCRG